MAIRAVRLRVPGQRSLLAVIEGFALAKPHGGIRALLGLDPLPVAIRDDYRHARIALRVGAVLDELGPQWDVLHELPGADDDETIDHVVIGPTGVFAITDVDAMADGIARLDRVRIDHTDAALRAAEFTADRLSTASGLPVTSTAIIAVSGARQSNLGITVVPIVPIAALSRFILGRPAVLDGPAVARISDVADRGETWPDDVSPDVDSHVIHREFQSVRQVVESAAKRRLIWGIVAFVLSYCTIWAAAAIIAGSSIVAR